MRLQIAGGLAVPWKENVKLHLMIGSGGVALEDLEGIRRKKRETRRHRVEIQPLTRHHPTRLRTCTYRRGTRERQWVCHDDLTDKQFIILRPRRIISRRFFFFFFFPSFTLVGMYYASDEFILGYDKPNTTWTGPTA